MIICTNDDLDLVAKNISWNLKDDTKTIVVAQSFRIALELARKVEHLNPSLTDTKRKHVDAVTFGNKLTFLPLGFDGSKVSGLRADNLFLVNYDMMPKDKLATVVAGFMATCSNPIQAVKEAARARKQKEEANG